MKIIFGHKAGGSYPVRWLTVVFIATLVTLAALGWAGLDLRVEGSITRNCKARLTRKVGLPMSIDYLIRNHLTEFCKSESKFYNRFLRF